MERWLEFMNRMMTGVLLDGTKVGNKCMTLPHAHFHLEVLILVPPKRLEWVKMNLDSGAAVNTFTWNFSPEGAGDGRFYRTASGEWMQFQGYDENGLLRSLNRRPDSRMHTKCQSISRITLSIST